jgi:hypothetical protein
LDLGQDRTQNFVFDIRYPNGTTIAAVSKPLRDGASILGTISLDAGEDYAQTLVLNEWFDFSAVGIYEIEVGLAKAIRNDRGLVVPTSVSRIVLNVLPRNESRLSEVCEDLVRQIETSRSVEDYTAAAGALRHVSDPIAIPFLERALRSGKYVEQQIIGGLERIGGMAAAQALMSVLAAAGSGPIDPNTRSGTRAILARQALQRIELASTDLALKQMIREAVASSGEIVRPDL